MNRIDAAFEKLRAQNEKALITFITAGDPDMDTTVDTVLSMFENGADIVELGVPFSDPIAEGVTIQESSLRSLNGGTTLDGIFDAVARIRERTDKPLILMMYLNTIFVYGTERFFDRCETLGIDGVIVPDMPYEEREEIAPYAEKYGKPVHIFYNRSRTSLSAMLTGDAYFTIHPYDCEEEIYPILDKLLKNT